MGSPKALLPWGSGTFVQHLCRLLDELGFAARGVITRAELADRLQVDWPIWLNPDPDRGMLSSLQTALQNVAKDCPWLMVTLVDQPAISLETFRIMSAQASETGWSSPVYEGRRGHPVVIGHRCFAKLSAADPAQSPRDILSQFPRTLVEVSDPCIALDFDTPEEWQAFQVTGLRVQPPSPAP
jgi:CTP:molybdopterin cytidylyltransferase MocA